MSAAADRATANTSSSSQRADGSSAAARDEELATLEASDEQLKSAPLRIDTSPAATGVRPSPQRARAREKHERHSAGGGGAGAPAVWVAPDWATYPVIENFYGQPHRTRVSSFYEVMCSPTDPTPTTTLGESCCAYDDDDEADDERAGGRGQGGSRRATPVGERAHRLHTDSIGDGGAPLRAAGERRRRKFGSFSYSCSTDDTNDDVDGLQSPVDAASALRASEGSGFSGDAAHSRRRRSAGDATRQKPPGSGSGFAAWNRIRRTVGDGNELVPVPHAGANVLHLQGQRAGLGMNASRFGNPQAGSAEHSPSESVEYPESPAATPPTPSRLRFKLNDSLAQIDARIQNEREMAQTARSLVKQVAKQQPSVVWSLICGAKPSRSAQSDGLAFLLEQLSLAVHNRALNQLQRHRRHVNGILQIVTSHNPDLELTEKQLDSFESADDMLGHDLKHSLLAKQLECLQTSLAKRKEALVSAKMKNGPDCFELPRAKNAMLLKLLEAVSWYRLMQTNSREESASTSVVASAPQDGDDRNDSSSPPPPPASVGYTASRSLQEIQVEKILNVLAGEEFYSDYNELMCKPDWWEIAQAHFENLVFAKPESRVCQWMSRMSNDVAAVSQEALEEAGDGSQGASKAAAKRVHSERRQSYSEGMRVQSEKLVGHQQQQQQQARPYWASDPQPEQILDFVDRLTRRVRREFDVPNDVSKSLSVFVQRAVFPRVAVLCFNQKAVRDCQRKDKLWRKKCAELSGIDMERLNVPTELADKIRSQLPSRRTHAVRGRHVYLIRAIEAFNSMSNIVPCDLLEELMHGVIILHHEAALVLGTTQFSVETFFPLLAYVLLHCRLPRVHAQLHLLENYAITNSNVNGEESYYVYCVHAAVEYVCNSSGLASSLQDTERGRKGSASSRSASPSQGVDSAVHPIAAVRFPVGAAAAAAGDFGARASPV